MADSTAIFGTLLGMAPGEVPVYSSHYASANSRDLPDRESYRSYLDGIFMGYKWQCVEFARRWLYINKGYIFDDIAMAYDIFDLRYARSVKDNSPLPLHSFKNGSQRKPEPGCLLIWSEGGEFVHTGHVAIITEVLADRIRIVEQNVVFEVWPEKQNWSRELSFCSNEAGYRITCSYDQGTILGWVMQTEDSTHAEPRIDTDPQLFNIIMRKMSAAAVSDNNWMDITQADEAAYIHAMGGQYLTHTAADRYTYFCLSESAIKEIKHASNELHAMFMHVTHQVLQNESLLERFNLPRSIWPKIRESWNNRQNQMITGRFDFSVSERGIKVYEYNADSASCYLEAGKLQGKWFEHFAYHAGYCPGEDLYRDLVNAWHKSGVGSVLHIMQDHDYEETYHAQFIQAAAEEAGLRCKVIKGMAGLSWDDEGFVVDKDGERILWVWKTWAWETALDQLREECDEDEALALINKPKHKTSTPRLVDVLLRENVMVYEPLWTLIPSNKAILPLLCDAFPDSPYLLDSRYELNDDMRNNGYVTKPIAGRCGFNISIVDKNSHIVEETTGEFGQQDQIYQQLFKLPKIDKFNVQLGTFTVDGKYSSACVRVDVSPVITTHSDLLPLRILDDAEFYKT